jgi:hypothetical protein
MTPEELAALGQAQKVEPYQIPQEAGIGSVIHDTLFDPTGQVDLGNNVVTDVDGNVPQDLQTPNELDLSETVAPKQAEATMVTPHDVATARELNNQQPEMIDKKVGESKTTTTQQTESQASKDASAAIDQSQADMHAADAMQFKAVADEAKIEGERSKADNDVIAQVESARAAVQMQNQAKFQQNLAEIDTKVAELANYKPESFWGSKSTADKIGASIAVGLGSFSQAVMGGGQNIGMMLLNRQMDEFDNSQKVQYQNKLNQIQNMRASLNEKEQLAADLEKTFDAQKLAARAQVQSQFAKASAMAKTPQVQAAILQKQAQFDQNVAKIHAETAAKYEARSTETTEKDILQHMQRQPGTDKNGNPIKLSAENDKARLAYADVAAGNQALKGTDVEKLTLTPQFQKFLSSKNLESKLGSVPYVGNSLVGLGDALHGTSEQYIAETDPEAAKMNAAIQSWTRGVIRYKSGAAIAVKEEADERNQYWPALGDTPDIIKQKAAARKEIEKAIRQAGALE